MKSGFKLCSFIFMIVSLMSLIACGEHKKSLNNKKNIVVTYPVLGSLVKDLVQDQANVIVSMPKGLDPHEWEPSAKDVENLVKADLIIQNGLNLEGGMIQALNQAKKAGVPFFTASEHITIRYVKSGEGLPTGDPDQAIGAADPHLWLNPQAMKQIILALSQELKTRFQLDLVANANILAEKLENLDKSLVERNNAIPKEKKLLVTGHESLGYFAEHYGYTLVGAIVPSLTTEAEVSASDMTNLKKLIKGRNVKVIFTELGTPPKVAQALAKDAKVKAVEINTHNLPEDDSYFSMLNELTSAIVAAVKDE